MMKKLTALVMLLVMALCCCTAQAEFGYTITKSYLNDNAGTGFSMETWDGIDNWLWINFDFDDSSIFMTGTNSAGKQESTFWSDLDATTFVLALGNILTAWGTLEDTLDSGYSLMVVLTIDEDPIFVDTEEKAEAILEIINN